MPASRVSENAHGDIRRTYSATTFAQCFLDRRTQRAQTLLDLILTCGWCITTVVAFQLPGFNSLNLSSPAVVDTAIGHDDPRFAMQVIYGVTDIPITPVIMNTVGLMAHYAEMDFLGGARHGYPQVEIALTPAPPAITVEVRLVIWALYGAVIDMTFNNGFKESEIPFI